MNILKQLSNEFDKSSVTFRPGALTKNKDKAIPLAYIDARDVMDRLDSVLGAENWEDSYEFNGTRTICTLKVRIGNEWISKSDGAGDTNIEGDKGGLSDAFKRAAVKWGVGRYLYKLRFMWAPVNEWKRFEDKIDLWDYLIAPKCGKKKDDTPKKKEESEKTTQLHGDELFNKISMEMLGFDKLKEFSLWWKGNKTDRKTLTLYQQEKLIENMNIQAKKWQSS